MDQKNGQYKFYREADIPSKWTLNDLLLWVACNFLPEANYDYYGQEVRESYLNLQESPFDFCIFYATSFDENTTTRLGLKLSPDELNYRREEEGKEFLLSPDHYDSMAQLYPDKQRHFKALAEEARELEKYADDWSRDFDEYIDIAKSKIHVALHEERLRANGIKIYSATEAEMYDEALKLIQSEQSYLSAFEVIPGEDWYSSGIRWRESALGVRDRFYFSILFRREDIFAAFPPRAKETVNLESNGSDVFFISQEIRKINLKRVGRPSKHKQEMEEKIVSCLSREELPQTKDSLIHELIDWYNKKFGNNIAYSTVAGRVKPHWDKLHKPK